MVDALVGFVDHIEAMPALCANAAYRADGCGNGALVLEFRLDVALATLILAANGMYGIQGRDLLGPDDRLT